MDVSTSVSSSVAAPRWSPGTVVVDRFTVQELVGFSAQAEIYGGQDGDGTPVLLKLLSRSICRRLSRDDLRAQVAQTFTAVAQLAHKNIATTQGFFWAKGEAFLATEGALGMSLRQLAEKNRGQGVCLSLPAAYHLAIHIANALAYAHGAVAHGSLGLDAVSIDRAGRVKIADFGMYVLGALEQPSAPPPTPKGDLQDLCALLFELLTGQPVTTPFQRPSQLVPDLLPAIDAVLETGLAGRCASAEEFKHLLHDQLGALVGGVPTPARRPPPLPGRPIRPPSMPVAKTAPSTLRTVEDSRERWLLQKDRLDYGPYRLAEVKEQIAQGKILGDHLLIDTENGERRAVKDHPLLASLVRQAELNLAEHRRAEEDAAERRRSRRRLGTLLSVIAAVLTLGGVGVMVIVSRQKPPETRVVYKERDSEDLLKGIEITMKIDPAPPRPKRPRPVKRAVAPGDNVDVTNLGDASEEGGDEVLSQSVVQQVMATHFGVLKGCVLEERRRNPGLHTVDMDFVIRGTGQVSAVKVNGQSQGPAASCMLAKLQTLSFPRFNGARTNASFSMNLK